MTSKTIISQSSPLTQSVEAVVSLLSYLKMPTDPMHNQIDLVDGVRLVRSRKGDVYHTATPRTAHALGAASGLASRAST